uniref:Leucine-rich repeat-containing N-terminal plant-type domain-containing protein n=1 Tax=Oryza nivara TaxID=4536 RepID=A0A0E0IEB0_ORYNI
MDCDSSDRASLLKIKEQLGNPDDLLMAPSNQLLFLGLWHHMLRHWPCLSSLNVKVPIPSALGDLPLLQTIQLEAMAGMYGPIPSSFAKLCHLQFLFISGTSISGSIPDFLVKTNLSALSITNSKLNGSIPESLSLLPNLRTLTPLISHTTSSSAINPSFLFDIAKPMAKIDLSWNRLEFDMTKVRFPHHLNYLDLSHNSIKGRVAKSLKDINLKFCNVSYNELCGEIPTGRYMAYHGADCYVHNKCLCGSPLPPCKNGKPNILTPFTIGISLLILPHLFPLDRIASLDQSQNRV